MPLCGVLVCVYVRICVNAHLCALQGGVSLKLLAGVCLLACSLFYTLRQSLSPKMELISSNQSSKPALLRDPLSPSGVLGLQVTANVCPAFLWVLVTQTPAFVVTSEHFIRSTPLIFCLRLSCSICSLEKQNSLL